MDDLISRKALLDDLCQDREEGTFEFNEKQAEAADKIVRYMFSRIEAQSSAPAVPLDKLCEWLAERFYYPCQIIEDCNAFCTPDCVGHDGNKVACWKKVLTKWMEGLEE